MTDNAPNDKYSIPYIRNTKNQLDNTPPNLSWIVNTGNPTINKNTIIFYESSGDTVNTDPDNSFDITLHGYYFQCILPDYINTNGNKLYFGGYNYGAYINHYSQLYTYNNDIENPYILYNPGDLFQQIYDGNNVKFYINGMFINSVPILNSFFTDYLYCGLDTSYPTGNSYTISNIYGYVTGKNGTNGISGVNGIQILSGSGIPSDTLGLSGEYYMDILTNILYGPKLNTPTNRWITNKPVDPVPRIISILSGGTTKLWDFINGYQYLRIYLIFSPGENVRQPDSMVQLSVNSGSNGPQYFVYGNLPSNIIITTVNNGSVEQSINVSSTGTPDYEYIGVKIQVIA
jgi:hypothetical protein